MTHHTKSQLPTSVPVTHPVLNYEICESNEKSSVETKEPVLLDIGQEVKQ